MKTTGFVWRKQEQLPDGRWQHYCIGCNAPHTEDRFYQSDFRYRVPCKDCTPKDPGFGPLKKSFWD